MTRTCPECGGPLEPWREGALGVDGCERCGGIWFDSGELALAKADVAALDRLAAAFARPLAAPPPLPEPRCPACAAPLQTGHLGHFADVPVLGCAACRGGWLHEAALRRLRERVYGSAQARAEEAGGVAATPAPVTTAQGDAEVFRRKVHPLLELLRDVLLLAVVAWLFTEKYPGGRGLPPTVTWPVWQVLAVWLALVTPFKARWVRVTPDAIVTSSLLRPNRRIAFADVLTGYVSEAPGDLSDAAPRSPYGGGCLDVWAVQAALTAGAYRMWLLSKRGVVVLGAEYERFDKLIDRVRRAMGWP